MKPQFTGVFDLLRGGSLLAPHVYRPLDMADAGNTRRMRHRNEHSVSSIAQEEVS